MKLKGVTIRIKNVLGEVEFGVEEVDVNFNLMDLSNLIKDIKKLLGDTLNA